MYVESSIAFYVHIYIHFMYDVSSPFDRPCLIYKSLYYPSSLQANDPRHRCHRYCAKSLNISQSPS